jgi:hypothetical protein
MTEEELRAKQELKRQKQHAAWERWYRSPKGKAYRQKLKERKALNDSPTS